MARQKLYHTDEQRKEAAKVYAKRHKEKYYTETLPTLTAILALVQTINKKIDLMMNIKSEESR